MNIKIYPKALFGYCGIIILFRLISIYVDANLGMAMFASVCAVILIAIVLLFISNRCISVYDNNTDLKIAKNECFTYKLKIMSKLPIAFAFVEIKLKKQEFLKYDSEELTVGMVDSFSPLCIDTKYKAAVYGIDFVGVEYIRIRDFMGILSIKKKIPEHFISVKTLPKYTENNYNSNTMFFSTYIADFDDSEETSGGLPTSSGFPGYEHREYVMGDSLKRVNYKLSAKKDKLMIRLDEPSTIVRMAVVLDDTTSSDRYNDEITIEGMMSYVGCLVKNKITTDVYYNLDGKRKKMTISDDRDLMTFISEITQASLYFKGESKMENVKLEKVNNLSSVVVFSALGHIVKLASNIGIPYRIVTPNRHKKGQEVWYLDKNLDIIMGGVANGKN